MPRTSKRIPLAAAALLAAAWPVAAQTSASPNWKMPDSPKTRALGPLASKMDSRLVPVVNKLRKGDLSTSTAAKELRQLNGGLLKTGVEDLFAVRIDCAVSDDVVASIRKTGAQVTGVRPEWNTIEARATVAQISALADVPGVRFVTLESGAATGQSGSADNHADIDMRADLFRTNYSMTGTGQKIGVLSDTCNRTVAVGAGTVTGSVPTAQLSGTAPQVSGDLPSSYRVVDFGPGTGIDEGAAMMELVYDIAPGANLAFASAFTGQTGFASNIDLLRTSAGCTVICDDVFYYEEPFFQDGPITQAVDRAVTNGIPYFTLAGNHYNGGILTTYNDVNAGSSETAGTPTGVDFHNWGIATATPSFLPVQIGNGTTLRVTLQWNQPWSSYGLGSGSQTDMDLYLYDSASVGGNILASSLRPQGTTGSPAGDASEYVEYTNNSGSTKTYYLAVDHYQGVTGNVMRLVFLSNGATYTFPSGGVNGPTIYGHMAATNAITVGAIFYGDIATNGSYGPDFSAINAESFSSKGGIGANGIPIYFTTTGATVASAPQRRDKPDIAAPDGTNTTFFGSDTAADADTKPNFFGTSAATPNAAAVGALLRQKFPALTPATLKSTLKNTAIDVVASSPASGVGTDEYTGAGRIDAVLAAQSLLSGVHDWSLY